MSHNKEVTRAAAEGPHHLSDRDSLSVVIVTYQNAPDIGHCLSAVYQAAPDVPMDVIIVDNASEDDTVAVARRTAPEAQIIEQVHNGGFADGCAAGAHAAIGRWLLFLNPDAIISPDAIQALLDCAAVRPSAGIIGGRFVDEDGNTDPSSWWGSPSPWSALCFALGLNTFFSHSRLFNPEAPRPWTSNPDEVRRVPIVSGAFMLVKRELWQELGGFELAFFMYGEDADFCMRAAKIGNRPIVTARAVCQHAGGKSSSSARKLVLLFTGKSTLIRRHFPRGLRSAGIFLLLTGVFVRASVGGQRSVRPGITVQAGTVRPRTRPEDWQALWANRNEWRNGWTYSDHRRLLSSRSHVE